MTVSLRKINKKGSYRWIAENFPSLPPAEIPIGVKSANDFIGIKNLEAYRYKRISTKNAIVLTDRKKLVYVYVRPSYRSYRKFFSRVTGEVPNHHDVDHVLSKKIAIKHDFQYVLLCAIPARINRSHGVIEREHQDKQAQQSKSKNIRICFANERIFHKVLSRTPGLRMQKRITQRKNKIFSPNKPAYRAGLTLKQQGLLSAAFRLEHLEMPALLEKLIKI